MNDIRSTRPRRRDLSRVKGKRYKVHVPTLNRCRWEHGTCRIEIDDAEITEVYFVVDKVRTRLYKH